MGIWSSSNEPVKDAEIVTDKPEVKVEVPVTPVAEEKPVKTEFKGLPVRVSGDRIWLLKGGKKAWITNKETFEKLGFRFGDEREIDFETLQALPEGEPLR